MPDSVCSIVDMGTSGELTSTDAGVAYTITSKNFTTGEIGIVNTGATNTVQYKIDSYLLSTGGKVIVAEVSYTDIAPLGTAVFKIDRLPRAKFIVTVKSKVASTPSTVEVEYCLGL